MGFLCNKKEEEKIVSLALIKEDKLLSDLGLSNIYNINPNVEFCREVFTSPQFTVLGAVELVSGLTTTLTGCTTGATAIYNFDYTPNFNINILLTGGTEYTGYTGSLCYKLFDGDRFVDNTSIPTGLANERLTSCVSFSAITSTTITQNFIQGSLPNTWGEYLMRFYYTFISKECNKGQNFNTWENTVQVNRAQSDDRYFMTIVDPPEPILPLPGNQNPANNYNLISVPLLVNGVSSQMSFQAINGNLNYWILPSRPNGGVILLTVNGITLTQGTSIADGDYRLIDQGWSKPIVVELFAPIAGGTPVSPSDVVIATYINSQYADGWAIDTNSYFMDTILIDGFTTDASDHYRVPGDMTINNCVLTCIIPMQQMFLTKAVDSEYSIIVYVNGVQITENLDFFLSSTFPGRINFNPEVVLKVGDIVSVLAYAEPDNGVYDYGTLNNTDFTVNWSINEQLPNNVSGYFTVRLYDEDSNLLLFQNSNIPYLTDQVNYSSLFTNLPVNVKYKFEVVFKVDYHAKMDNNVSTCSFAYGYFNTNNLALSYRTP